MNEENFVWIQNKEKFLKIQQSRDLCVACSIENILKYYNFYVFDQNYLATLGIFGFKEAKKILSSLLKDKFEIELKTKDEEDHDSKNKVFENIKRIIKEEGIPVAVSFYSKDVYGNPTNKRAHIRISLGYNHNKIKFFEQETGEEINFDLDDFKKWLNKDHHCLIIRKKSLSERY